MSTMAENVIVVGAENRPPMLERSQYDSWQSLKVPATPNTRALTRDRTLDDLIPEEKIRKACDIRATKIIFQDLPPDVYTLMNHHTVSKEIWDRVKLLIEGSELSLQERELKLYNEFDRFTSEKEETIYLYYLSQNRPIIEENGVTRPKKYYELSATKAIQADCDVKATNIVLQGLPPEVYALVSNHKVAKELWERIQLLMQGTSLTKQERECKLYDEFDKFAYKKGETQRNFYLRFSLLINDMNIYNMKLEQFQVNTKFLNTLPPEWSKFVIDVKLVWDLHTTNIDQLHAYLGQLKFHANEVHLMDELNSDLLALSQQYGSPYQSQQYSNNQLSTPLSITYPSNDYQSSVHHNVYSPPLSIPQLEYAPTINQQPKFPQLDSGLIVLVFQKGNDPIDAINHMMSFLTTVVTSRYPTTNNQLKNSSNPRQQATINDGRVTLKLVQGRKTSFDAGTTRTYTPRASGSNSGKQRTVTSYNCKGEGHMSKQCTKPKRKRDDSWFKDKLLMVQAQANGQILHEEEPAFLADPGIAEDALTEVHNPDNMDNNMINEAVHA
ncbi:hypothetical protein Tco_0656397, partial [Tanacetum coccineum]